MSAQQLAAGFLFLGAVALGATQYLGSPWPGVVLAGLSLGPAWWDVRNEDKAKGVIEALGRMTDLETQVAAVNKTAVDAHLRIEEQGQQINSLRSTVSLRGTLGG